jgi:hypothetical protein
VKETVFLGYSDGELEPTLALRKDLTRIIRKYKPEVAVTGNPDGWFYGNDYVNTPIIAQLPRSSLCGGLPLRRHAFDLHRPAL